MYAFRLLRMVSCRCVPTSTVASLPHGLHRTRFAQVFLRYFQRNTLHLLSTRFALAVRLPARYYQWMVSLPQDIAGDDGGHKCGLGGRQR